MRKIVSKNLTVATLVVCVFYVAIFLVSRIDALQKQNQGKINGEANAAYVCPAGYIEIADFCIQSNLEGDESWYDAAKECAENEDARLCRAHELMAACQAEDQDGVSFGDNIDGGGWEWADDIAVNDQALVVFNNSNGCKVMDRDNIFSDSNDFRCCKNRY